MAHRDLGDHLRSTGNLQEALKYYIKTRDHCSTSEHVVEMCISVIEVSLDLKEYHAISAYVSKAEGLLDSYNPLAAASSKSSSSRVGPGQPASKGGSTSGADAIGALFRAGGSAGNANSATLSSATAQLNQASTAANREAEVQGKRRVAEIRCKLNVAQGIAFLGMAKYKSAKTSLLEVDISTADSFTNVSRFPAPILLVLTSPSFNGRWRHEQT
jgi:COP9 signalosome complex subunit 1